MKKYKGKETAIYNIKNYGSKIWFIDQSYTPESNTYTNQTAGCGCNHPSANGVLFEIYDYKARKKPDVFNPDWWYGLWHRRDGYYTNVSRKAAEKDLKIKKNLKSFLSVEDELHIDEWIKKHKLFITHADLKLIFENQLRQIIHPEFFDCEVVLPFGNQDKYGNRLHSSEEAWVHVHLFKYRPVTAEERKLFPNLKKNNFLETVRGIVTWENCD